MRPRFKQRYSQSSEINSYYLFVFWREALVEGRFTKSRSENLQESSSSKTRIACDTSLLVNSLVLAKNVYANVHAHALTLACTVGALR